MNYCFILKPRILTAVFISINQFSYYLPTLKNEVIFLYAMHVYALYSRV